MRKKLPLEQQQKLLDQINLVVFAVQDRLLTSMHADLVERIHASVERLLAQKFIVVDFILDRLQWCRREVGRRRALGPLPTIDQLRQELETKLKEHGSDTKLATAAAGITDGWLRVNEALRELT